MHSEESLLISSSLDKTIRLWNFDTGTQTFRLETGEEIVEMGLLSSDLLYYHSHHHLKIWSLNLFHSLFTILSSRIRRWARVKSPGYPARVLLLVFTVTPFKIDQNKKSKSFNSLSPESGNRKKVDMQRLSPRFRSQQFFLWKICGETFFSKFIEICMETPCWCPPRWAPTWRPETNSNICH